MAMRFGHYIQASKTILGGFRKKRSQQVGKAVATGSMIFNVIMILVILTLAVVLIVFIKGGIESVMETWKSIT